MTCGAKGTRTPGLLDANQTLFQLSYSPEMSSAKGTAPTGQRGLPRSSSARLRYRWAARGGFRHASYTHAWHNLGEHAVARKGRNGRIGSAGERGSGGHPHGHRTPGPGV